MSHDGPPSDKRLPEPATSMVLRKFGSKGCDDWNPLPQSSACHPCSCPLSAEARSKSQSAQSQVSNKHSYFGASQGCLGQGG